jgi:hypothetical protein
VHVQFNPIVQSRAKNKTRSNFKRNRKQLEEGPEGPVEGDNDGPELGAADTLDGELDELEGPIED